MFLYIRYFLNSRYFQPHECVNLIWALNTLSLLGSLNPTQPKITKAISGPNPTYWLTQHMPIPDPPFFILTPCYIPLFNILFGSLLKPIVSMDVWCLSSIIMFNAHANLLMFKNMLICVSGSDSLNYVYSKHRVVWLPTVYYHSLVCSWWLSFRFNASTSEEKLSVIATIRLLYIRYRLPPVSLPRLIDLSIVIMHFPRLIRLVVATYIHFRHSNY